MPAIRLWPRLLIAFALLAAGLMLAFSVGRLPVSPADLLALLASQLGGPPSGLSPDTELVLLQVRAPRVLAAAMIGAALALAGAAFQALFRNPLVSPDILGASSGAALGALLGIFLGTGLVGTQISAFAGGLAAVWLVYLIGARARRLDPLLALLLAGIMVGALLGAGAGLLKILADPHDQLPAMTYWLLGSLAATSVDDLSTLLVPVLAGSSLLLALRWRLDAVSLPEDEARSLGVPLRGLRLAIIAGATLLTAASVAAAGIIGWIGLVVPHLARLLVGPGYARLLPVSAIMGAALLLLIDTLARSAASTELPLGVLTALIGTPCFLWLLLRAPAIRS